MDDSCMNAARLLPDLPQWLEIRAMLLSDTARLVGSPAVSPPAFVVLDTANKEAGVVGRPPREAIEEAAAGATEILAAPGDETWIAAVLPKWRLERAAVHVRLVTPLGRPAAADTVRYVTNAELAAAPLTRELREELRDAQRSGVPIAAAFVAGMPVSFCYAGSITEAWWDISIDTVEPFRRRGYAQAVAEYLIADYAVDGKAPVWCALPSNAASMSLAQRLGFERAATLLIFTAPAA
jgi:hypothetical protein